MARYLYSELASLIDAIRTLNANKMQSSEWIPKHEATIDALCKEHLPSGSGFDSGSVLDFEASHAGKLVFTTSFHHMNDGGYAGWTDHTVIVTPSFIGNLNIRISGRNRNDIKEAIHEAFGNALRTDVTYDLYFPLYPQFALYSRWEDKDGQASECYQSWGVKDANGLEHSFWNDYPGARDYASNLMVEASRAASRAKR